MNIKFVLYVSSTYKEDQIKTQTFIFYLHRFSWMHLHNSSCIDSELTFEVDTLDNKEQFEEDHRRLNTFINSSHKEEINENHKHM